MTVKHRIVAIVLIATGVILMLPKLAGAGVVATYYGPGFYGSPTASGDIYDPNKHTAAHPSLPFGTQLQVEGPDGSTTVTVNDRGPFGGGAAIDLSEAAAEATGVKSRGVAPVEITEPTVGPPPAPPQTEDEKPSATLTELPKTGGPGR